MINMFPCWENNVDEIQQEEQHEELQRQEQPQPLRHRRDATSTRRPHHNNANAPSATILPRQRTVEEIVYLVKRGGMVPLRPTIRPVFENLDAELVSFVWFFLFLFTY